MTWTYSFAVGDISACHAGTMWHSSASRDRLCNSLISSKLC